MKTKTLIALRTIAILCVLYFYSCSETPLNSPSEQNQTIESNKSLTPENQEEDGPGSPPLCNVNISLPSSIVIEYPTSTTNINYSVNVSATACGLPNNLTLIIKLDNVQQTTISNVSSYSGTLYNVPVGSHTFSVQTVFTGSCFPPPGAYSCLNNTHYRNVVVEQTGLPQAPPPVNIYTTPVIVNNHPYLTWAPGTGDIVQYEVYRGTQLPSSEFQLVAVVPLSSLNYTDNSVNVQQIPYNPQNTMYFYKIHSRGSNGLLSYTNCNGYHCWAKFMKNDMPNED